MFHVTQPAASRSFCRFRCKSALGLCWPAHRSSPEFTGRRVAKKDTFEDAQSLLHLFVRFAWNSFSSIFSLRLDVRTWPKGPLGRKAPQVKACRRQWRLLGNSLASLGASADPLVSEVPPEISRCHKLLCIIHLAAWPLFKSAISGDFLHLLSLHQRFFESSGSCIQKRQSAHQISKQRHRLEAICSNPSVLWPRKLPGYSNWQ